MDTRVDRLVGMYHISILFAIVGLVFLGGCVDKSEVDYYVADPLAGERFEAHVDVSAIPGVIGPDFVISFDHWGGVVFDNGIDTRFEGTYIYLDAGDIITAVIDTVDYGELRLVMTFLTPYSGNYTLRGIGGYKQGGDFSTFITAPTGAG